MMPLWAVSELMTFGDLVHFYQNWKETDRIDFLAGMYKGNQRKIARTLFTSWMESCRKLRNVCAHAGQLYGRYFPSNPRMPKALQEFNQSPISRTLWARVLAIQFLYPDEQEWENWIVPRLQSILDIPAKRETNLLLRGLGFPKNWKDVLDIWKNMDNPVET